MNSKDFCRFYLDKIICTSYLRKMDRIRESLNAYNFRCRQQTGLKPVEILKRFSVKITNQMLFS